MKMLYAGVLAAILDAGTDHGGNPVARFEDQSGGWPLRCCLTDSVRGDQLAIIALSPFPWDSAHRETGPVVLHTETCGGASRSFPAQFETRDQLVRAFGNDAARVRTQVYDHSCLVPAGEVAMQRSVASSPTSASSSCTSTMSSPSAIASRRAPGHLFVTERSSAK